MCRFGWKMAATASDSQLYKLTFTVPADAYVGKYNVVVVVDGAHHSWSEFFYLVFNPWCAEDTVYMKGEHPSLLPSSTTSSPAYLCPYLLLTSAPTSSPPYTAIAFNVRHHLSAVIVNIRRANKLQ